MFENCGQIDFFPVSILNSMHQNNYRNTSQILTKSSKKSQVYGAHFPPDTGGDCAFFLNGTSGQQKTHPNMCQMVQCQHAHPRFHSLSLAKKVTLKKRAKLPVQNGRPWAFYKLLFFPSTYILRIILLLADHLGCPPSQ